MADFTKHRLAKTKFVVNHAPDLNTGASLTGSPTVLVTQRVGGAWVDKSSEFGITAARVSDTVEVTLAVATGTQQDGGLYHIRSECATNDSEVSVLTPTLEVTEAADPNAP